MLFGQFLLMSLAVELTPGPNMGYLAALSMTVGRRAGAATVLGIASGLALQAIAASLGLVLLINDMPGALLTLKWLGVAFLIYLAGEAWVTAGRAGNAEADFAAGNGRHYLRGLVANIVNPKSLLFFAVVVPDFLDPAAPSADRDLALLCGAYVAVATLVHGVIVLMASALEPTIHRMGKGKTVSRVFAVLLAVIAVWLAFG